jgi:translation elongation factor EF-4
MNGSVKTGSKIKMIQTGKEFEVVEVGVFKPKIERTEILKAGDVGYISASIKTVSDISVGDTITEIEKFFTDNSIDNVIDTLKEVDSAIPLTWNSIAEFTGKTLAEI